MNSSFSISEGTNNECESSLDLCSYVEDGDIAVPEKLDIYNKHSKSEEEEEIVGNSSSANNDRLDNKAEDREDNNKGNSLKKERSHLQLKVVKVGILKSKPKNSIPGYFAKPQKLISRENLDSENSESSSSKDTNDRNELGYPCLKCGVVASQEKTARRHNKAHESGYLCLFCPQVFFKKHTADMHIGLHRNGIVKHVYDNCQCKICGGSFISLMYLEFHVTEIHGEDILLSPKIIHFSTSTIDEMGDFRINDVKRYKKYKCGICNALFTYPLNLDCHMEFHRESIFACGYCKSSFTLLDDLLLHMKIHDNKSLDLMFEDYLFNFDTCLGDEDSNRFQGQNSFEQILEIEDQSESGKSRDSDSLIARVHQRGSRRKFQSSKEEEPQLHLKVRRNNIGLSNLKILNKKIITRKKQTTNQVQHSNQTNYKIKTKDWFKNQICVGQQYINPYLFHFLPNGKFSHYFENVE